MTRTKSFGVVMSGLALAVALQFTISPASALAETPDQGGPSAPSIERADPPQAPQPSPEPSPAPSPKPDGFTVGSFVFKPGGRVKLDVIRDFDPIGSEDSFDVRTIPVDGSDGTNSNLQVKETRLSLDVRGPVEGRQLRMYVETDFYGTGSALRLRHAYGVYSGLLAGQTWSTFVDDSNIPNTIDFEAPTAFALTRQAQARWTQKLGKGLTWSAAVEDNKSAIVTPTNVPGKAEYPMPDLVTRLVFEGSHGHIFGAGFVGKARFRPTGGEPDDVTLWGAMLSGKLKTFGRDYAYAQFTFGDGVGRYRGATTAVPDATGRLHAVGVNAFMGGYEHFWSPRFSSNAVYSVGSVPSESFYPATFNKRLDYAAVNLLYWFLKDRAWTGVEYLYGRREVFGGDVGTARRLQFAIRFNLPS